MEMKSTQQAHDVLWRRLKYMLSPQWDIYLSLRGRFRGQFVLEVGFGTGAGVLQYCSDAIEVDALEIDEGAVHFAQTTFPLMNVNWLHEDIVDFQNHKSYQSIIAIETMEHIPEWEDALANISELLDAGGRFYMTARNRNADLRRWKDLHERELNAEELLNTLHLYFDSAWLFDYSLKDLQKSDTTLTPLVAIAEKKYR